MKTDSLWRLSGLRGTNPLKTTVVSICCKMLLQKQYRCPGLFKSSCLTWHHFTFAKDRCWYLCFHKKRQKGKQCSGFVLQWALIGAARTLSIERDSAKLSPQEGHSASSHHRCELYLWAAVLYLDLFYLLARCVLRHQKSQREVFFWVWEFQKFFKYKLMFKKFSI